jgi:hypothetical protein
MVDLPTNLTGRNRKSHGFVRETLGIWERGGAYLRKTGEGEELAGGEPDGRRRAGAACSPSSPLVGNWVAFSCASLQASRSTAASPLAHLSSFPPTNELIGYCIFLLHPVWFEKIMISLRKFMCFLDYYTCGPCLWGHRHLYDGLIVGLESNIRTCIAFSFSCSITHISESQPS